MNKKCKNEIYKLGEVDDRIPVLQLSGSSGKSEKKAIYESKKMVLNQAQDQSKIRLKRLETFLSDHKLNCDQLVDMHHTQN